MGARAKAPNIEEIQDHTSNLRDVLAPVEELIRVLQDAAASLLPREADLEAMSEGRCPPEIAWEVHRWLEAARSSYNDLMKSLDWAGTANEHTLLAIWLRRLCNGKDQTAFRVLSKELQDSPSGEVRFSLPAGVEGSDPKKLLRALVVQMAQQLYKERTGGELAILPRLRKGYQWTQGVTVLHITEPDANSSICGRGGPGPAGSDADVQKKCRACWKKYPYRSAD